MGYELIVNNQGFIEYVYCASIEYMLFKIQAVKKDSPESVISAIRDAETNHALLVMWDHTESHIVYDTCISSVFKTTVNSLNWIDQCGITATARSRVYKAGNELIYIADKEFLEDINYYIKPSLEFRKV